MRQLVLIALLFCVSCQRQTASDLYQCTDATVYDLGHLIRYQHIYGIQDYEEFARTNHLEGSCNDSLIKSIFEIIDLISDAHTELDLEVGWNDVDGRMVSACETRIGGEIMIAIKFTERLGGLLERLKTSNSQDELQAEIIDRLHDDVRILTSESYKGKNIYDRKLLEIYLDLHNAEMKLLFSETILFEKLKSGGSC